MTEQTSTLAGLQTALQMENDGKAFYLKASKASSNPLGAKLLQRLSDEEDLHRQKFERIYRAIQTRQNWPEKTDFKPDGAKALKTIFAEEAKKPAKAKGQATELDAVQTAIKMEAKTYDFYKACSKNGTHVAEKDFYETVAREERGHQLMLLDYYEYLKDPGAWFVKAEHTSLDGG